MTSLTGGKYSTLEKQLKDYRESMNDAVRINTKTTGYCDADCTPHLYFDKDIIKIGGGGSYDDSDDEEECSGGGKKKVKKVSRSLVTGRFIKVRKSKKTGRKSKKRGGGRKSKKRLRSRLPQSGGGSSTFPLQIPMDSVKFTKEEDWEKYKELLKKLNIDPKMRVDLGRTYIE